MLPTLDCRSRLELRWTHFHCRIWQSILDLELTLLAQLSWHLRRAGVVPRGFKQFRVDAILVQAHRKTRPKVLDLAALTHGQLSPPSPFTRFPYPRRACDAPVLGKCAKIPHSSPTMRAFCPVCQPGNTPCPAPLGEEFPSRASGLPHGRSAEERVRQFGHF